MSGQGDKTQFYLVREKKGVIHFFLEERKHFLSLQDAALIRG